jgi:hypothetical protein
MKLLLLLLTAIASTAFAAETEPMCRNTGTMIGELAPGSPYTVREELLIRAQSLSTSCKRV